jgi:hypothetical protein
MILLDIENRNSFFKNLKVFFYIKHRIKNIVEDSTIDLQPKYPYQNFFEQEINE